MRNDLDHISNKELINMNIELVTFYNRIEGKRAVVSLDGKRLLLPRDTSNTRSITSALPVLEGGEEDGRRDWDMGFWVSSITR